MTNVSFVGGIPVPSRVAAIQARLAPPVARSSAPTDAASFESVLAQATGSTGVNATSASAYGPLGSAYATGAPGVTGTDVPAVALQYVGVPYVWGGNEPATGLDCSGFTKLVFGSLGVTLPRVSTDQARMGSPVSSLAEARPGDLLAFGSPVDHVGIYLGNNKMVHAAGTGKGVRVEDVYRQPTAIRRLLPTTGTGASYATPVGAIAAGAGVSTSGGAATYASLFAAAGAQHGVDPALLSAVARAESGYNPSAVSSAGALGLMQIMPATADGLGVDPLDPAQAVDGAARYLRAQLDRFGSVDLALAAYNAGPGAVARHGGVPPYAETQKYVTKVLAYLNEATTAAGGTA